ncbi:Uncharacterized protein GcM1_248192 [Golovinomyces cichoracearum]|uniref:Uncharacterized protein n=1 Tax=Golovinomyces cichoracearum TaxID=62708 RepID=A0A420ID59_9PEZI|nr:Uncharacterized protein GcM1_248192 [Golovinomyces cichoracearum]
MTSHFTIQKPHLISSLPHLIGTSEANYFTCEVFGGGSTNHKKRKRSELAVGINGEGVNLYDISSSRLIASYGTPPQTVFTCPPCSLRTRVSNSRVERRTYVSLDGVKPRITLFHDFNQGPNGVNLKEFSQDIKGSSSHVVFVGCVTLRRVANDSDKRVGVILVKEDCEIQCQDGDSLQEEWTSPASALFQESQSNADNAKVEFVQLTDAYSASQGIMRKRSDIFTSFPHEITEDGFNPEILILITKSEKKSSRTLHIVGLPQREVSNIGWTKQRYVHSLLTLNISFVPELGRLTRNTSLSVHVSSGTIQQLEDDVLTEFDLLDSFPKEINKLKVLGAQSFLRLSNTSTMVSSGGVISIYNPKYQCRLATVNLDMAILKSVKRKRDSIEPTGNSCKLLSYFPKLGLAVALAGNNLIGIQIECRTDRHGRPLVSGLLIDSIGGSFSGQTRHILDVNLPSKKPSSKLQTLKPIQHAGRTMKSLSKHLKPLERSLSKGTCTEEEFDHLISLYVSQDLTKPAISNKILKIDKEIIIYALSKIFTMSQFDSSKPRLSISFYTPKTFKWLIDHGHITIVNIESALRRRGIQLESIMAGELTRVVTELDPELELLQELTLKTYLGADELLHVIGKFAENLGLWGPGRSIRDVRLRQSHISGGCDSKAKPQTEPLEAKQQNLDLAGNQIIPTSQTRDGALSLALSKLYSFPDKTIVSALQKSYDPESIVSLMNLLRLKLARGGWTVKYLAAEDLDEAGQNINTSDNSIILLSTILNCCIDAIGAGDRLFGDARFVNGGLLETETLIKSLKAEVSLALEGIEEMVYLRNILAESVHYSDLVLRQSTTAVAKDVQVPLALPLGKDTTLLPLGLKVEKQIIATKICAGEELTKLSRRDVGDRKSRKVGKYTREIINV